MSFRLQCSITTCHGQEEGRELLEVAAAQLPYARTRHFLEPFEGIIVAMDAEEVWEQYEQNPDLFPTANSDEAYETIFGGLKRAHEELSRTFPSKCFGYIEVECFGGVCLFSGEAWRGGECYFYTPPTPDGHLQVLKEIHAGHSDWHFEPFTRGYFDRGDEPSPVRRRMIQGELSGYASGLTSVAFVIFLANELKAPWCSWVIGKTIFVCHGEEDVYFSLNPTSERMYTLNGIFHVESEKAIQLLNEFCQHGFDEVKMSYEVDVLDLSRARLASLSPKT